MEKLHLKRFLETETHILGALYNSSSVVPICYTLENPWIDNKSFKSCIPVGRYKSDIYSSDKFPHAFIVKNVLNRDNILIHTGNYVSETSGCILIGDSIHETKEGEAMVSNSRKTLKEIIQKYPSGFILEVLS